MSTKTIRQQNEKATVVEPRVISDQSKPRAILKLDTEKNPRRICEVRKIEVSDAVERDAKGWLHIKLSTGTTISFNPVCAHTIAEAVAASRNGKGQ